MLPLRILWSDASVVAVWKPAGMPVQPDPSGDPDLLSLLRAQLAQPHLQLTHRLDRPVSGVVLFAASAEATAALNAQFRDRKVQKVYWAIVEGQVSKATELVGVVRRDPRVRKAHVAQAQGEEALAKLKVRPLAQGDRYALLEVLPTGGAFHQIRAQLSAAGWPIKGDVKYGARRGEKDRSILLHARAITFDHPAKGVPVHVVAPVPESALWLALTSGVATDVQG